MNHKTITVHAAKGRFLEIITQVGVAMPVEDLEATETVQRTFWTNCLWDTGATHSAVTKETAEILGLQPMGETTLIGIHGEEICNFYRVSLNLPHLLFIPDVKVTEGATNEAFGVILGMDVICTGDFAITNVNGNSTFSFCVPSLERIDFSERVQLKGSDLVP